MSASQKTQSSNCYVATVAQGQSLVCQSLAVYIVFDAARQNVRSVNESFTLERNIMQIFAPDERVVPVAVSEVLKVRIVRLWFVVSGF